MSATQPRGGFRPAAPSAAQRERSASGTTLAWAAFPYSGRGVRAVSVAPAVAESGGVAVTAGR